MFSDLFLDFSIVGISKLLRDKKISSVELVKYSLKKIEESSFLNCFITVCFKTALEKAKESERRFLAGEQRKMEGIPIAIKDCFCTRNLLTSCASKMLSNFFPPYTATVVNKLCLAGGMILVGKTNMDEFAMGSSTETSYYGPCYNVWRNLSKDEMTVPGGSSGGSASAVAAGIVPAALGTDTGGSIRQPAALTGTVGFKPSYGRCSRYGVISFAPSFDCPGPIARTVVDAAFLVQNMAGYDNKDSVSLRENVPDYLSALGKSVKGMKVGSLDLDVYKKNMSETIVKAWDRAEEILLEAGVQIKKIKIEDIFQAIKIYYTIGTTETFSNLACYDGIRYGYRPKKNFDDFKKYISYTRTTGFGREVRRRILLGSFILRQNVLNQKNLYQIALKLRSKVANQFLENLKNINAILLPTSFRASFLVGELADSVAMYLNDIFTTPASICGLPAISIPTLFNSDGLPVGMQLIGSRKKEEDLFSLAHVLEKEFDFKPQKEQWWRSCVKE